jgi:hypothetical protein
MAQRKLRDSQKGFWLNNMHCDAGAEKNRVNATWQEKIIGEKKSKRSFYNALSSPRISSSILANGMASTHYVAADGRNNTRSFYKEQQ